MSESLRTDPLRRIGVYSTARYFREAMLPGVLSHSRDRKWLLAATPLQDGPPSEMVMLKDLPTLLVKAHLR